MHFQRAIQQAVHGDTCIAVDAVQISWEIHSTAPDEREPTYSRISSPTRMFPSAPGYNC
jgi:hypothetical protein